MRLPTWPQLPPWIDWSMISTLVVLWLCMGDLQPWAHQCRRVRQFGMHGGTSEHGRIEPIANVATCNMTTQGRKPRCIYTHDVVKESVCNSERRAQPMGGDCWVREAKNRIDAMAAQLAQLEDKSAPPQETSWSSRFHSLVSL